MIVAPRRAAVATAALLACAGTMAQAPQSPIVPPEERWGDWAAPSDTQLGERVMELFRQGRSTMALDEVIAALTRDPTQRGPYALASELYRRIGEDEAAIGFFAGWALQRRDLPHAYYFRGFHESRLSRLDEAAASYATAVARDPRDPLARFRLAGLYHLRGRFDEALEEFRRARELDAASPDIAVGLSRALRISGDYEAAGALLEETLALSPDAVELHYGLSQIRSRQGRDAESEESLRRAIELRSDHIEALRDLGALLQRRGEEKEGRELLARAEWVADLAQLVGRLHERMQSDPEEPGYPLLLAELELVENRIPAARRWFERAARLGATRIRLAAGMAWVHLYEGELDLARRELARLGQVADPHADLSRAALLFAMRRPERAIAFVGRAVSGGPQDRAFLTRASNLCRFGGLGEQAAELMGRAIAAPMPAVPGLSLAP